MPRTGKSVGVTVVRRRGKNDADKDFRVRRDRVQEALLWLRRNNRYYSNIEIDHAALNPLPDDGPLPDLQVIEDDDLIQPADVADNITDTGGVIADTESSDDDSNDGSDAPLQRAILSHLRSRKSESDVIRQAVDQVATSKSKASLVSEQRPTQSESDHGLILAHLRSQLPWIGHPLTERPLMNSTRRATGVEHFQPCSQQGMLNIWHQDIAELHLGSS